MHAAASTWLRAPIRLAAHLVLLRASPRTGPSCATQRALRQRAVISPAASNPKKKFKHKGTVCSWISGPQIHRLPRLPEPSQLLLLLAPHLPQNKNQKTENRKQKTEILLPSYFRVPPPHYQARPRFFFPSRPSAVIHRSHVRAFLSFLLPPPLSLFKSFFVPNPIQLPNPSSLVSWSPSPRQRPLSAAPTLHTQQSRCSSSQKTSRGVATWVLRATPMKRPVLTICLLPQMLAMTTLPSQTLKTATSRPRLRGTTRRPASGMPV